MKSQQQQINLIRMHAHRKTHTLNPMNDPKFLFLIVHFCCVMLMFRLPWFFLLVLFFPLLFNVIQYHSSIYPLYPPKSHDLCAHWQSSHFHSLHKTALQRVWHFAKIMKMSVQFCAHLWPHCSFAYHFFAYDFFRTQKKQIDSIQRMAANNYKREPERR